MAIYQSPLTHLEGEQAQVKDEQGRTRLQHLVWRMNALKLLLLLLIMVGRNRVLPVSLHWERRGGTYDIPLHRM